jgi:hypothetical protein
LPETPRERGGADAADALEGGAEREGAAVADLPGDRADGGVRLAQQVGREGQPPAGEERHGRLADQLGEAAGQRRTGDAGLGGQLGDRPRVGRVVVEHPQGLAHHGIAVGPVPGRGFGLRAGEPGAQDGHQ